MMQDSIDMPSMSSLKAATSYISTSLHDAVKLRIGKQGLAASVTQTIPQFFRDCCQRYGQLPALVYEDEKNVTDGGWTTLNYTEYWQRVEQTALLLLHVGLQPRSTVCILAFNCPEWFYTELGAVRAGGVVAGIYTSSSPEAVHHVLDTAEATVCVVDDAEQMAKVRAVKSRLPRLRAVLQLHGPYEDFVGIEEGYYRWEELMRRDYDERLKEELERRERNVSANECAVLIFTSGTVGMPKAVMLSHDALICDARAIAAALSFINGAEVAVTYLPLNHIAAQMFDIFLNFEIGGCIYFADRNAMKGTLGKTLTKARPTRLLGVPRIFEKMQEKLGSIDSQMSQLSKYVMEWTRETLLNYHIQTAEGKSPSTLKYWLAAKIMQKVRIAMGLDMCHTLVAGGAPVSEELKRFFMSIDMPLIEAYGLSETSGASTLNVERCKCESVGKALDGIELKISNPDCDGHGEICIRGRTCFMGYLNEPLKTKESIKEDGWFNSGDIGYLDTDGNLVVSGRIKELIITAGGENIPPVHIENLVKRELKGISNAVVVGDRKKYLTILLTIKTEMDADTGLPTDELHADALSWMRSLGLNHTKLSQVLNIPANIKDFDAANVAVKPSLPIVQSIEEGLKRANQNSISSAQRVQKFTLLPHDLSIPTGELGPTLKMRRNIVLQKYASIIEQMYN